ncbi:ABC transporter permease [Parabacteroides sp. Marseille-P3160]|uniref:ABC transporter permease n=1 Tax=Parabacteroides sp. Marseille-P3160 TaxID=1917887 RepID=UPI0009BBD4B9|nr:ABC transporter permease [Parabacteroides sp. Marseille-P3160]
MLDFDNIREIWSTIKKNKLRTFLTGFSVSWGIFMLITLLGAGNGLKNGVMSNFSRWSDNRVSVRAGYTTMPYQGMQTNRRIRLETTDLEALSIGFPEINAKSSTLYHNDTLSYKEEYGTYSLNAIYPDHAKIDLVKVLAGNGRFINDLDLKERRKVIVISPRMAEVLFKEENPLGKIIKAGKVMYQVIGVYDSEEKSNDDPAFIPFTTGQILYGEGQKIDRLLMTLQNVKTKADTDAFEKKLRERLGKIHKFNPEDKGALYIWNTADDFRMMNGMMNGIALFIWIVGIGTLTAGIVGVSNIMLITVRERTKEFGIRKAIGASPLSILQLVILESILITAVFGYFGMIMGIGVTELVNYGMEMAKATQAAGGGNPGENTTIFLNPTVNLGVAISATILIIGAGVLAGYMPARKAVKITAIEAMRAE